jgi:hypothetical protein
VGKKLEVKSQICHKAGHHAGSSIMLGLQDRFSVEALAPMLDECVLATGESDAELLTSFWLNGFVNDITLAQQKAIHRTSAPEIQLQIELIVRGFLAAHTANLRVEKPVRVVKHTHRCPKCWGTARGKIGKRKWQRQVNGPIVERCYACDQSDCDCEWVVECRTDEEDGVQYVVEKIIEVRNGG